MQGAERPDCLRCRAFFVTYDARRRYGCRTFAIKSPRLPALEVREASGSECAAFEPKPLPPTPPRR